MSVIGCIISDSCTRGTIIPTRWGSWEKDWRPPYRGLGKLFSCSVVECKQNQPTICWASYPLHTGRGYIIHMLRYTGMCYPNGLVFHKKISDMGPIFIKISLQEGHTLQKLWKILKISCYWGEKTLRRGLIFDNFKKTVKSAIFWRRKILR